MNFFENLFELELLYILQNEHISYKQNTDI